MSFCYGNMYSVHVELNETTAITTIKKKVTISSLIFDYNYLIKHFYTQNGAQNFLYKSIYFF